MRDLILKEPIIEHGRYLSTGCVFKYHDKTDTYSCDTYILKREHINYNKFLFLDDLTRQELSEIKKRSKEERKKINICEL